MPARLCLRQATEALLEERHAGRQHRNLERARKAAELKRASARLTKLRDAIRESGLANPDCRCQLSPALDDEQLKRLGTGCKTQFVCPRLDRVRRRMGL